MAKQKPEAESAGDNPQAQTTIEREELGRQAGFLAGMQMGKTIFEDSVISANVKTFIRYQNWAKLREIGSYAAIVVLTLAAVGLGAIVGG